MLILAWFTLRSVARKEYWWSRFNVAGGLFYGPDVYSSGLSRCTLSGAALLLLFYCLAGVAFGALAQRASRLPILLRAALFVALLHAFAFYCLWPAMGAFAASWFPWQTTLPADLILLLALTRFPVYYKRLTSPIDGGVRPPASVAQPPEPRPELPASEPPASGPSAEEGLNS